MVDVGQQNRYGCGEYIPGTIFLVPPQPPPPIPRIIIPKHKRTNTKPPLPGGNTDPPTWDRRDPVNPQFNPDGGNRRRGGGDIPPGPPIPGPTPGGPGPVTPGNVGPGGPGGGIIPPRQGTGGAPTTPPPSPPRLIPPVPPISGPSTPGPVGPATPGPPTPRNEEEEDDPIDFEGDLPNQVIPPIRLEDEGNGGGDPNNPIGEYDRYLEEYRNNNLNEFRSTAGAGISQSDSYPDAGNVNFYDLRDDGESSMFSNSFSNNNNTLYDPIKNIMDHSNSLITYVANTTFLDIFKERVASEVSYLLDPNLSPYNYKEKYITGLTDDKLLLSLNSSLVEALERIVDSNGVAVGKSYFLDKIKDHLLKGTLANFDTSYYIDLANSLQYRTATVIERTSNEQVRKNYVLSLLSNNSVKLDGSNQQTIDSIKIARMRFLLSDLESTFDVETIDGNEYQLELKDAGVEVDYAELASIESVSNQVPSDYVPPGEGDGYYYKIETSDGNVLPLVLDTQFDKSYYINNNTRVLALNALGKNTNLKLQVSLAYDDSEYGSNYQDSYEVKAQYFKLDLRTTDTSPTDDSFVEEVTATYTKLSDDSAIQDHAKTFGSRVLQLNIQYDDPFFQYADRSEKINLSMKDITFRQFEPKRTPTGDAIIVRNLPDGFVIYPVNETKDNPTGGYSTVLSFGSTVTREIECETSFHLFSSELEANSLSERFVFDEEGKYQYGLIGLIDPQNLYYMFDREKFPNIFTSQSRSPTGKLIFEVIERIKRKYSFRYLTWWDVFRRIPARDFAALMFDFPRVVYNNLSSGFLGFPIKDVLYRRDSTLNNLTEIDPSVDDPIYLDESERDNIYQNFIRRE